MAITHGYNSKNFVWWYEEQGIKIENSHGISHKFSIREIHAILSWLKANFDNDWFPLANNVEKLGNGTERDGLGVAILGQKPGDITHAQGSSYLGVVLEEAGIFKWNGIRKGIQWRIINRPNTLAELKNVLRPAPDQ